MEQTLLLNATYEPLKIVHWQKAVTLWVQGKVEVISVYDREIRAVSFSFRLPSVIRLLRRVRIRRRFDYVPSRAPTSTRATITPASTAVTCFPTADLTFDHVVPVAHGGRKDWENIVTCCITCNRRKGGRTPEQAGMRLVRLPRRPGQGARPAHHDRSARRAGELARLSLLERRARRRTIETRLVRRFEPVSLPSSADRAFATPRGARRPRAPRRDRPRTSQRGGHARRPRRRDARCAWPSPRAARSRSSCRRTSKAGACPCGSTRRPAGRPISTSDARSRPGCTWSTAPRSAPTAPST